MTLKIDMTGLEVAREMMESLYRSMPEARRAGQQAKERYGRDYEIVEVTQSVQGRPPRLFWKVIYKT